MISLDPTMFPSHPTNTRYCLASAHIAVQRFLADTKNLVRDGVEADTEDALNSADDAAKDSAISRRTSLRAWLKSSQPLGYGEDTYVPLLRAINPPGAVVRLPVDAEPMSTSELASLFYAMGKANSPKPVQAPIWAKGSFLTILRVAIKFISDRCQNPNDRATFTAKIFAAVLDHNKVHHVPWTPPPPPGKHRGRRARAPVYNWWRNTGKTTESGQTAAMQVLEHDELEHVMITQSAQKSRIRDATADWSIGSQTIGNIHKFLAKQSLPQDWTLHQATLQPDPSDTDYVVKTYKWVQKKYNVRNEIQHLGLIMGYLMSRVTPYLANDRPEVPISGSNTHNTQFLTATVRATPWKFAATDQRKGLTERGPFIVMLHVYFVALMEAQSPLRKYMLENKGRLGASWTKKHG